MHWELATRITEHLAGMDARLVQFDMQDGRLDVLLPNSYSLYHIYLYEGMAQLVLPINNTYNHVIAECTVTKDGEIILN